MFVALPAPTQAMSYPSAYTGGFGSWVNPIGSVPASSVPVYTTTGYSWPTAWPPYYSYLPRTAPGALAVTPSPASLGPRQQAEHFKNQGNEFRKQRLYPQAIQSYKMAIQTDPSYTDAYFNLAQLHSRMGNTAQAIHTMTQLLSLNPQDHDARVTLGEYYEKLGNTQEAKKRFMEVLQRKPDFDPARRKLDYLLYLDQKQFFPDTADALVQTRLQEIIHKSRELLKQYYTLHRPNPYLLALSQHTPITFGETQKVDDSANIAEYDADSKIIRIQPQMLFSTPNIVSAYLVHELAHALDEDALTSVKEEQDGYRELARFWSVYQGAENDPNLDRALELYQQGLHKLDQQVRKVYTIRDPHMPDVSPGHGQPHTSFLGRVSDAFDAQPHARKLSILLQLKKTE